MRARVCRGGRAAAGDVTDKYVTAALPATPRIARVGAGSHLGTPRDLLGGDGSVRWSAAYTAWGKIHDEYSATNTTRGPPTHPDGPRDGGVRSPFRLLGQYYDEETGLSATRFRMWEAETGRWLSPDPLGVFGGANLLGFDGVSGNDADPLGLSCDTQKAYRFAARANPATLKSNLSRSGWFTRAYVKFLMNFKAYRSWRAHQHMRGNTKDSPFVSLILKPERLATSTDPWARTIVTGSPGLPGVKKAPDLATFEIPKAQLYHPRPDNRLSVTETEVLYYGDDLSKHLVTWQPNPY